VATLAVKSDGSLIPGGSPAAAGAQAPQDPVSPALLGATPRRVATLTVKPDGSIINPVGKPDAGAAAGAAKPAATDPAGAPDPAKPAASAKKRADKPQPTNAASLERRASRRVGKPLLLQSVVDKQPPQSAAPGPAPASTNPLSSVSGLFRRALETAHIVGPSGQ
jgi:hypothetical protein